MEKEIKETKETKKEYCACCKKEVVPRKDKLIYSNGDLHTCPFCGYALSAPLN